MRAGQCNFIASGRLRSRRPRKSFELSVSAFGLRWSAGAFIPELGFPSEEWLPKRDYFGCEQLLSSSAL